MQLLYASLYCAVCVGKPVLSQTPVNGQFPNSCDNTPVGQTCTITCNCKYLLRLLLMPLTGPCCLCSTNHVKHHWPVALDRCGLSARGAPAVPHCLCSVLLVTLTKTSCAVVFCCASAGYSGNLAVNCVTSGLPSGAGGVWETVAVAGSTQCTKTTG